MLLWVGQRVAICSCVCCGGQDRQGSVRLDKVAGEACTELVTRIWLIVDVLRIVVS